MFVPAFAISQTPREYKIDSLVNELLTEQSGNHPEFTKGIFPSYRIQAKGKDKYADDNIFFSGIIAMRLMRHETRFKGETKNKVATILKNIREASDRYRNKYDRVSYNFWQTRPVKQFPGDAKLMAKTRYHIPDDADDSAVLTLINKKSKENMLRLKELMEENVPGKKRKIRNTLPAFKSLSAYSTWLGDRMPPEFDFCVMANIIYVFNEYNLPYTQHDWATLTYLRESFVDGYLKNKSHRVTPQYKTEAAGLYHMAFLISAHTVPALDDLRPQLLERILQRLKETDNKNEALLLYSALSYLKHPFSPSWEYYTDTKEFPIFYANLASVTPNPFHGLAAKQKAFNMPYHCKAWNVMLELEIALNTAQ